MNDVLTPQERLLQPEHRIDHNSLRSLLDALKSPIRIHYDPRRYSGHYYRVINIQTEEIIGDGYETLEDAVMAAVGILRDLV